MQRKKGFTIVELIVVMAIMGVMVLFASSYFLNHTDSASALVLQNDLKLVEDVVEVYKTKAEDIPVVKDVTSDMRGYIKDRKLYGKDGAIKDDSILNESNYFKVLDSAFIRKNLNTKLNGHFIINDKENIFYLDLVLKIVKEPDEDVMQERPIIDANIKALTNENVTINISYSPNSIIKEYKLNDGEWQSYLSDFIVNNNVSVFARGTDKKGNYSEVERFDIDYIDKTPPSLTLTQNITTPTKNNVDIKVNAIDISGIGSITLPDGSIVSSNTTYSVDRNNAYLFKAKDKAGNETEKTITISNIDKTPPVITIEPYNTNPTNKDIVVKASANEGVLNKNSHTFTSNGSFEFIATDDAGNISKETVTISNIDKIKPVKPTITEDNGKITINYSIDSVVKEYKINSGSWQNYTNSFTPSANSTIIARGIDAVGNISDEASYTLKDTTPPGEVENLDIDVVDYKDNGQYSIVFDFVTPTDEDLKGINIYRNENKIYSMVTPPGIDVWDTVDRNVPLGTYEYKITTYDIEGNESNGISEVIVVKDTKPPVITINPYNTAPTNQNVTVSATTNEGTLNKNSHTFTSNGSFEFIATDEAGNVSKKMVTITNIDKVKPSVSFSPNGNMTEKTSHSTIVNVIDENALTSLTYQWAKNSTLPTTGTWRSFNSKDTLIKDDGNDNFYLHIKAVDIAGNITHASSNAFRVKVVYYPIPIIDNDNNIVSIGCGSAPICRYRIDNGSWQVYAGPFTMEKSGKVSAQGLDEAGNLSHLFNKSITVIIEVDPFIKEISINSFYSNSIEETDDLGYILAGEKYDNRMYKAYLAKTDILGNVEWIKIYEEDVSSRLNEVIQTSGGGYLAVGYSELNTDSYKGDAFMVKTDNLGETEWMETFGGSNSDEFFSVVEVDDGGYLAVGYSRSTDGDMNKINKGYEDIILVKIDTNGNIEWSKTFGGSYRDIGFNIIKTDDNHYVITGHSSSNNGDFKNMNKGIEDAFIIKIDGLGNKKWAKTYGFDDVGNFSNDLIQTSDGGFLLAGRTGIYNYEDPDNFMHEDFMIVKTDNLGNQQWIKAYGGSDWEDLYTPIETSDGGYLLLGYSLSNDGDLLGLNKGEEDAIMLKLDSSGNKIWVKNFGGSRSDLFNDAIKVSGGDIVTIGHTDSRNGDFKDFNGSFIMRLDKNGNYQ